MRLFSQAVASTAYKVTQTLTPVYVMVFFNYFVFLRRFVHDFRVFLGICMLRSNIAIRSVARILEILCEMFQKTLRTNIKSLYTLATVISPVVMTGGDFVVSTRIVPKLQSWNDLFANITLYW